MNILVCGARGFVGAALCERLERCGHRVIRGVRKIRNGNECAIDYMHDLDPVQWEARLRGVDVVINAVGILVEDRRQRFDQVHAEAPIVLFDACVRQGVKQVIQISALGAQSRLTPYFASKFAADSHLLSLRIRACVVRPALVYGASGKSAAFFRTVASLPVHALPAGGHQRLRPVHVDDLTEIVERLIDGDDRSPRTLDVVGGEEVEYREMLAIYRRSLGFDAALRIAIPGGLIGLGATLLDRVPGSMLTRDTWRMLQADNTADVGATASVLQRPPRGLRSFISLDAKALRRDALDAWQPALLRVTLAFVWIWTAIASVFLYPRSASLALLTRAHLYGTGAAVAFYLAVALDVAFGILTLLKPRRLLWLAQGALIAAYTTIITVTMPETWADPFGAILKNLPIFVLLLMLFNQDV